ncbi:hypothetical protein RND71_003916 [Anisodus tanguticus]|uniref:Uncharacterized protein n=1 Tax=Anisodus tanguticus TaxID=243964 RepID=A0AAE1VXC7_9SOLA|nr:hypothetical protein RND71_003916 [Anisodus tanguticus]
MAKTSKDDGGSAKCLSGILRRILCSGSLPTHPCDQFIISEQKVSVSSLDNYMPQFDLAENFHHKRVRTSTSFCEILAFDQEKTEPEKSCNCRKLHVCRKQNVRKLMKPEDYFRRVSVVGSKAETRKNQTNKSKHNTGKLNKKFTKFEHPNYAMITDNVEKSKEINREADYYIKALGEICRLTEETVKKSCWVGGGTSYMFESLLDLCFHFEQQLLDRLINQVVQELAYYF